MHIRHTFWLKSILCPSLINNREYYSLIIKYTKSHHPNLCIKVGNTPLSLPCWWVGQLVMFSLKLLPLKKLYDPFLSMGFNFLKAKLWGESLLFNTRSPRLPGAHWVDLRRKNGCVDLGATQQFWPKDPWIGNPAP